ncbi:MAG TPA: carbohydrate-binding protein [Limnochordales bacterium]
MKLSWDAIRRALGVPEPAPDNGRRDAKETGDGQEDAQTAVRPDKALDVELSAEVSVSPAPAWGGEQVAITYSGRLAQQGAKQIYLHYGIGPGHWHNVQEAPMVQVGPQRFQASVPVPAQGRLEFCFRDDRGQWDNNGGRNWSLPGSPGGPSSR